MSENQNSIPVWYWIISGLALIWNLMGVGAFVQQMSMTAADIAALPEAEQALYTVLPLWVKIAFGLAVIGGVIGCLGLILKKSWSLPILIISLIGVLIQMFYQFMMSNTMDVYGPGAAIMPIMIIVVSVFLVWLAKKAMSHKWIN